MNKRIMNMIRRGPGYMGKKAIYKADSFYRVWRKKIYFHTLTKRSDEKYADCAYCNRITSDRFKDQTFLRSIQNSSYYEEIIGMAEKCLHDRMPLYGRWTEIPVQENRYPWDCDFVNHHSFEAAPYTKLKITEANYEIKIPWELGRMHQLPILAFAWKLSGEEKYLEKLKWILFSFAESTRVGYGVQWVCAMEVGIRIFNILAAYSIIHEDIASNDSLHSQVRKMAYEHAEYLINNLETNAHLHANNHYLADLLGIVAVSAEFDFPKSRKRLLFAKHELEREIERQITDDGINIEMSSAYTRLDAEMLLYSALVLDRSGNPVSANYRRRLLKISEFLKDMMLSRNLSAQIGDNDSGRVLILSDRNILDYRYIVEMIGNYLGDATDVSSLSSEQLLTLGILKEASHFEQGEGIRYYPTAKIVRIHKKAYDLLICNTNTFEYDVNGHKHNDNLSFELYVEGKPFIVDPGTGYYTSNAEMRRNLRSDTAHNTFYICGEETNDLLGVFRADMNIRSNTMSLNRETITASHDAYSSRYGIVLQRNVICRDSSFVLEDQIKFEEVSPTEKIEWNFTLHPDVKIKACSANSLELSNGAARILLQAEAELSIVDAWYSASYHSVCRTKSIRMKAAHAEKHIFTISKQ